MENSGFRSFSTITPPPVVRSSSVTSDPALSVKRSIPSQGGDHESALIAWAQMALSEGEGLNAVEGQGENIEENIKMVMGQYELLPQEMDKPKYKSTHTENRLGKNINDIAAAITDFRPSWHYRTENPLYQRQADILDKLSRVWWYSNNIDLKLQLLVKQALVTRTGYLYVYYNPTLWNGLGDLDVMVKDYRDIVPLRPNSSISIQDSLGVAVKSRNTVNWAKARYGSKAAFVVPTADGATKAGGSAGAFSQPNLALAHLDAQRKKPKEFAVPLYDHLDVYLKDSSINGGQERVWVGPHEHPQGYWVDPGQPLYPRGRLLVLANLQHVLYDGGNPYWHGMFPLIKLTLDPQPWSFLGKSAIVDARQPQLLLNEMLQGIVMASRKALRPGIFADKGAVNPAKLAALDTAEPGFKLLMNPSIGQGIVPENPLPLPPYVMDLLARQTNAIDYNMGVLDMRALEQIRSMNGNVDVEAMLEYLGPSIRTKGRILEVAVRELGEMMKSNFFQFWTFNRRVQVLGKDGMTFEDFDYDPGSLVPSFSPTQLGESERGKFYATQQDEWGNSQHQLKPRSQRAQEHAKNFVFYQVPGSLLNMSKTQDQLKYMQLFRMGVIDPVTLLEKLEVDNIGELPGAPTSIIERMQAAGAVGFQGSISAAGRKSSGQEMPMLRPDGKISESG